MYSLARLQICKLELLYTDGKAVLWSLSWLINLKHFFIFFNFQQQWPWPWWGNPEDANPSKVLHKLATHSVLVTNFDEKLVYNSKNCLWCESTMYFGDENTFNQKMFSTSHPIPRRYCKIWYCWVIASNNNKKEKNILTHKNEKKICGSFLPI